MKQVYIIEGNTGEYSDVCSWNAEAHFDLDKAQTRLDFLNSELVRLDLFMRWDFPSMEWNVFESKCEEMKKHDPKFVCDYTGTEYVLETVDVFE